jgi:hypothetical protein
MPEISRFYGIIIRMYPGDHPPPHFHAVYAEHEAFVEIETGRVLYGSLPATALRLVQMWAAEHQNELRQHWASAERSEPLAKIAPLE